jgi:threonine/homoserine/homoserine lactone efflux protein
MGMTVSTADLTLFAAAFAVAIASPGPFAAALVARSIAFGLPSAAGMAFAGVVGDLVFAVAAMTGLAMLIAAHGSVLPLLRLAGAAWLLWLGLRLIFDRDAAPPSAVRGSEGMWAGFVSGLAVSLGNPKAALFYAAVFPGFFDIPALTARDIAIICALIAAIVLTGHLAWAAAAARAGRLLRTPRTRRTANRVAGGVIAAAGIAIAAT